MRSREQAAPQDAARQGVAAGTETPGRRSFEEAAERVRDTAKWILASFGAIGAALIVGIQFSDIGTLSGPRVLVALGALVLAFAGIVVAVRAVSALLLPTSLTMTKLLDPASAAIVSRIEQSKELIHPYAKVADIETAFTKAFENVSRAKRAWREAPSDRSRRHLEEATEELEGIRAAGRQALLWGRHFWIEEAFARLINRRVLPALTLALIGLVLFVFAIKQPPDPSPALQLRNVAMPNAVLTGAQLRGADLTGADLTGALIQDADLSGATLEGADLRGARFSGSNLRGASLDGAQLDGATWAATTCPDGLLSDDAGGSCLAHLVP
jgi:hypothetical protein